MKTKDIVTLIIALVIIVVSGYFGYIMLFPKQTSNQQETVQAEKVPVVPKEIDEKTYQAVDGLSDYGKPALNGLGKSDLFAN